MGNAAAKELKSTAVEAGSFDEKKAISTALVSKEAITIKNKGKAWVNSGSGEVLWKSKQRGVIKSHGIVEDAEGKEIAVVVTETKGMNAITKFICKSTPSFAGQEPLTAEELKKAGIDEGTALYKFSKIDTFRQMATAKATYSIVTGKEGEELNLEELFTADKLSAMGFMALFKTGERCFAKASTPGISMSPIVEAGTGVDLLAVVSTGYTLIGDGNAGALAGAGVI